MKYKEFHIFDIFTSGRYKKNKNLWRGMFESFVHVIFDPKVWMNKCHTVLFPKINSILPENILPGYSISMYKRENLYNSCKKKKNIQTVLTKH